GPLLSPHFGGICRSFGQKPRWQHRLYSSRAAARLADNDEGAFQTEPVQCKHSAGPRRGMMVSRESNRFHGFGSVVAVLAAGFVFTQINSAAAQPYVYQPAPDYYHNDTASGTFLGGAMGAITGAIIGGKKHAGQDALIGAGVGAVTGNLLGRSKDANDERRAAAGAAAVGQMNAQAAALAVTDADLVQMTRAGISEDVIISTMRSRGTRIDLSPQSLIALRQQGVSDRVVIAAQQ